MSLSQGTKLGHYEIRSALGVGGMGEVYLAQDLILDRPVAIKLLKPELTSDLDRVRRFEREAYSASGLNHPNILTIYEIGKDNDCQFIVTEFVDGESLSHRLLSKRFEFNEVLEIGIQIASALTAAHQAGIIHRDIKPDNIMLRRDGIVKVLDFGLAKLSDEKSLGADSEEMTRALENTLPGIVMGTINYMSPEQARGIPLDTRTDVWSLGVVIYQIIGNELPFQGKTMSDTIALILTTEQPPLRLYAPDAPTEIEEIVNKALHKEREDRYQQVAELGRDLEALKRRRDFEAQLDRGAENTKPVRDHTHKTSSPSYLGLITRHRLVAFLIIATILMATIAAGYFGFSPYFSRRGRTGMMSLAVLPLRNVSNDPEQEYLSDGIAESLINRLSQLSEQKVIANSSSAKFKGKDTDPRDIAKALNVAAILTGRILRHGDTLSISVELIDGSDGTRIWGQQFNRKTTDLLSVQAEISQEITDKLRMRLSRGQQQNLARPETFNSQAYELLLKGRFYSARGGAEDRKKGLDYYLQAIAADPTYAVAYAGLATSYRNLVSSGVLNSKEFTPKAEAAAQKAVDLDDQLARGHYALAVIKTDAWQWVDAEREFKRAIELDPNLAVAHNGYSVYLSDMGRHDEAIAEARRSRDLDPLSLPVNVRVAFVLYLARQGDQAIEVLKKMQLVDSSYPYTYFSLGLNYATKGMQQDAIASYQEAMKRGLDNPSNQIFLGVSYAKAGQQERAEEILKQVLASDKHASPTELAILYDALGKREQAFESLERAYEAHDLDLQYLGVRPEFDPLRSDQRFQNLLRRVGLVR